MIRVMRVVITALVVGVSSITAVRAADLPQLAAGSHISLLGNTLAERFQHDGSLETAVHDAAPDLQLSFRNLGFSGDELTLRLRSSGFGSPDDHLKHVGTDMIWAFFGYNEAYAGEAGLAAFREALQAEIKHWQSQQYNGHSSPGIVLFSPIAQEDLGRRELPDGQQQNTRLALYTNVMREVAAATQVTFVDLFQASQAEYASSAEPLTINGIHLNERGQRWLANWIRKQFFPQAPPIDWQALRTKRLRDAVLEKDFYWYQRYRTTDGFSIYGGRADLTFVAGQTNRVVMQREMEILDQMAKNRDPLVWARAHGGDLRVDDANTSEFVPVVTNKPGEGPGGQHVFLSGEESLSKMTVGTGMKVNVFATEAEFPELIKPVQMAFDTRGRLWVATWPSYPHWKPKDVMDDRLIILEDTDADGRADTCKTFASGLHNPTGFEFYGRGVIVANVPDLLYLEDTDGDDRADTRERILHGVDSADTHHSANSFVLDPGGALYFQEGTFHHTQTETPWGPPVRSANAAVFRFEPRTYRFDVYVAHGFANPHGHVFDRWGHDIVHDGTGAVPYDGALFSGHLDFPHKHGGPPTLYQQRTRPCSGTELLSSAHFPPEMEGSLLVCNVIGFQGILQYRIKERGASFVGEEVEPIVSSTDQNFRPADVETAPDGSIFFCDWQNPIIGHMQHNLRDPSRDHSHGRVYRVTYPSRPLVTPPRIAGESIETLVGLLAHRSDRIRYRAKIELSSRDSRDVLSAAMRWLESLAPDDAEREHHRLEVLWLHQYHDVVNPQLLEIVLQSPNASARAAGVRVLCAWRDRLPEALEWVKACATDEHPRVRLEAVRAASFFPNAEAVEVPLLSLEHPTDEYLDYVRNETMRALDPIWKAATAAGRPISIPNEAGLKWLLQRASIDELVKFPPSPPVWHEWLVRAGVRDELRHEALRQLAQSTGKAPLQLLLEQILQLDGQTHAGGASDSTLPDLGRLLAEWDANELSQQRELLRQVATTAASASTRQLGIVGLVMADRSIENTWVFAQQSMVAMRDTIGALPLVPDLTLQEQLYGRVAPLLNGIPADLVARWNIKDTPRQGLARYVRISLPGPQRTLTLAEVQVLSEGQNVALRKHAAQSGTSNGGDANRAIDGRTDAAYGSGTQTHTPENRPDPWWEVDLGSEMAIDEVVVFNRREGPLGKRLEGFTLSVLDGERQMVSTQSDIPAPDESVSLPVRLRSPSVMIRHATMLAAPFVRGHEAEVFATLAERVHDEIDRGTALQALARVPRRAWPQDQVAPLLNYLVEYIRGVPADQRNQGAPADALQLADALVASLPPAQAAPLRKELRGLGVLKVRVGTVPHRMAYDQDRLFVAAGKPIEIVLENQDIMPHNLVITQPGALEEVGLLAEATAQQPGAVQRQYVPRSDKILFATRLLQPRESQVVQFQTPETPGVYPFVCTYPGHWRRMYGSLFVVRDLERLEAEGDAYLASEQIAPQDELLKIIRPNQQWKLADLSPSLNDWQHDRSFATGKRMFQLATCAACHRMNGEGNEIGPDLTKLDVKLKPADVLQQIVEPSAQINKDFQSNTIELKSGQVATGLVVATLPNALHVVENPLTSTQPRVIALADIEHREISKKSIMPEGLLDRLTREEILDLLAYVYARGNDRDAIFENDGTHHHDSAKGLRP